MKKRFTFFALLLVLLLLAGCGSDTKTSSTAHNYIVNSDTKETITLGATREEVEAILEFDFASGEYNYYSGNVGAAYDSQDILVTLFMYDQSVWTTSAGFSVGLPLDKLSNYYDEPNKQTSEDVLYLFNDKHETSSGMGSDLSYGILFMTEDGLTADYILVYDCTDLSVYDAINGDGDESAKDDLDDEPEPPEATPELTPTPTPEPTPEPTPSVTTGQRNALSKAKQYLDVMPFSHQGLVSQLEYEGYTNEEAVYGADNCGADWNEQAALKAAQYLDLMAFSRSGLIDQLKYEGFTEAQAIYGAEANGY